MSADGRLPDDVKWRFTVEYVGGPWEWMPARINDNYLNGFFIGKWYIGWMR